MNGFNSLFHWRHKKYMTILMGRKARWHLLRSEVQNNHDNVSSLFDLIAAHEWPPQITHIGV